MRYLIDKSALIINDMLCVADLHIGLEKKLHRKGIHINISEIVFNELRGLVDLFKPSRILVAGDLVDSMWAYSIAIGLLEKFSLPPVILVPGNHDKKVEQLEEYIEIASSHGILAKSEESYIGIVHGHAIPSPDILTTASILVMGHVHPALPGSPKTRAWLFDNFFDSSLFNGTAEKYREKTRLSQIIVLPAFNPYLPGSVPGELADVPFLKVNQMAWTIVPVREK